MMRDIVSYYVYREPETIGRMLEDASDPRREAYLTRFADREGSEFIRQFTGSTRARPRRRPST
jgi:hypothetical protein